MRNPQSTAKIAGHPIHPMLIPFPIAFFVGTFACDLAFWWTGNPAWVPPTVWLLGAGLVLQASYYCVLSLVISPEARANDDRWRKAWNAAMVSTAAFAFSAYAMRSGILT